MSDRTWEAPPSLGAFRHAYLVANEAFNRHEFEGAFFGFDPECEGHTGAHGPGTRVAHSREEVIQQFRDLLEEFPDWRVEPREFAASETAIVVRNVATATGRESRVPIRQEFSQVWRFAGGRAIRITEFLDHQEALAAAGRPAPEGG